MSTFGFIGCGNMGSALARAVADGGYRGDIMLSDKFEAKAKSLAAELNAEAADAVTVAKECKFVFIGVKPQVIGECFAEIREALSSHDCVLVSMAAGVSIESLTEMSGYSSIIRIMPNLPVSVGQGVVLASAVNVTDEQKQTFEGAMSKSCVLDWIDEKLIDAASAVSGCGPAYAYMFIEALADGAVACGLPRDKALLYSAAMLKGSAEMVLKSGKHPELLKDEVCSPGGSTIAGVAALEDAGMRSAAINAVKAAYVKTKELGEK